MGPDQEHLRPLIGLPALRLALRFLILALGVGLGGCGTERPAPVVVIGLDGADWDLLVPWMEAGELPHLRAFLEDAALGDLTTVEPILSPVCWTSAFTGVNPGKHGIYDFQKEDPEGGELLIETATHRRALPIWMLLSDAGFRVAILNVPMTYPPDPVRGVMASGFPYPSGDVNFTYPPELQATLGEYPLDFLGVTSTRRTQGQLYQMFLDGQTAQGRVATEWLHSGKYDFLWVVFTAPDKAQHFFWKDMDPGHPMHTAESAAEFKDAILEVWRREDQVLADLLAELPENATVMLLSDHGFDAIYRQVNLENWLPTTALPEWLRTYAIPKLFITNGLLHHTLVGQVPGSSDREVFLDRFTELCAGLIDPATGAHPFEKLSRREDLYRGRMLEKAPDVVFYESPKYYVTRGKADSTALAPITNIWSTSFSGYHRPEGILALRSPVIRAQTQGTVRERLARGGDFRQASILDVAPTLLALMAQTVPDDMDGRVLEEVVDPAYFTRHPVVRAPVEGFLLDRLPPSKLTPEEKERLKALPYLQ